ncbi:hypothetical protein BGX28_008137 [Mortierella sp. GBA30]|nr:hypothetical protein BGX28_008137 [Mortierella sp. GBA30]
MNSDRDPTQVMASPISPTPSEGSATGISKIRATALLLKQKVAGTNNKPQKLPNKISHPWSSNSSSPRSSSFSSPTSPSPSSPYSNGLFSKSSASTTPLSSQAGGGAGGAGGGIKAMIAAREDPSLSCNKMAPGGTQPVPAPQTREARAGMTKVQLSPQVQTQTQTEQPQTQPQPECESEPAELHQRTEQQPDGSEKNKEHEQEKTGHTNEPQTSVEGVERNNNTGMDTGRRSTRRRNGGVTGGGSLVASQFATPSSSSAPSVPQFMKAFEDPSLIVIDTSLVPVLPKLDTKKIDDTQQQQDSRRRIKDSAGQQPSTPNTPRQTTMPSSPMTPTSVKRQQQLPLASMFEQRPPMSPRRHTTSSSPRTSSSSGFFTVHKDSPPVPFLAQQSQHPMSIVNPTLRQLQTPQIPTNLVQARILQQEEQKRRDEELAKVPITANLRTVKKIQAVLISSDDEDEGTGPSLSSPSSSASSSLSASSGAKSRPRSKTATSSSVSVSVLSGVKRRGDRNHVEPVAIPKRLADQVEHILGRKLAGKGNVLDEREKEREEEEARKAAEPLPPIVLGKPRKRAVTSSHIRNLVSSWDHKVEEAREMTSEAERIRQFLEERSTAHAELPKPKVPLTANELLGPLPSLPPPPPTTEIKIKRSRSRHGGGGHRKGVSSSSTSSSSSSSSSAVAYTTLNLSKPSSHFQPSSVSVEGPDMPNTEISTIIPKTTRTSRSGSKKTVSGHGGEDEAGYVSGPELGGSSRLHDQGRENIVAPTATTQQTFLDQQYQDTQKTISVASTGRLELPIEVLDTKRSGALLDNKAAASRPRRKGVRKPTMTKEEPSTEL